MSNLKHPNLDLLLQGYSSAASKHGRANLVGDSEVANQQYEIMADVCRELRARGPDAQVRLLDLLENPLPDVRVWASTHCLEFAPERAEPVLKELSQSGGLIAFAAEMTLTEWRKGALRFP